MDSGLLREKDTSSMRCDARRIGTYTRRRESALTALRACSVHVVLHAITLMYHVHHACSQEEQAAGVLQESCRTQRMHASCMRRKGGACVRE